MADEEHAPDPAKEDSERSEAATVAKGLLSALAFMISGLADLSAFLSASARTRAETVRYSVFALCCVVVLFLCYVYGRKLIRLPVSLKAGTLAVGLVAVMVACASAGYLTGRSSDAGAPAGSVTSPFPNESDIPPSGFLTATGWARNIPRSDKLWLFLYVASVGKYYMSDPGCVVLTGAQWTCRIYVGGSGQSGERFTLWLTDLGPQALQVLNASPDEQHSGFSTLKLAPDATPVASVTFTVSG